VISPQGEEDAKKHAMIHLSGVHPGMAVTEEELLTKIKTV